MVTIFSKKDDKTLVATVPQTTAEKTNEYSIDYLKTQRLSVLKSLNDFASARKAELAELDILITEAEKLGIKPSIDADIATEEAKVL